MTTRLRPCLAVAALIVTASAPEVPRVSARQTQATLDASRGASVTLLPDGTWLMAGGSQDPAALAIYDPATRLVRPAGSLTVPRSGHTATVLPDGRVLIAGGIRPDGPVVDVVEVFDPAHLSVTKLDDAALQPRAQHTATLMTDGRILFAGGRTSSGAAPAELWDPVANLSQPVGDDAHRERLNATSRLLPDGRVLMAGGRDGTGAPVDTTAGSIRDPPRSHRSQDRSTILPGRLA